MNNLQILDERTMFNKVFRMYGTSDEPLFLAKDVAGWIEHSDVSTMMRNVDSSEKVTNIVCTPGGNQESWFLTEDGLYEVKETSITHSDGHISVSKTPKITGKGQQYFISKFLAS